MGRDVSLAQKSDARIKSALSKSAEGRAQAVDDATVEIDETNVLTITQSAVEDSADARKRRKKEKKKNKKLKLKANASADVDESDSDGEIEAQEEALLKGGKATKAFEQRDLVSRAFAGENHRPLPFAWSLEETGAGSMAGARMGRPRPVCGECDETG